MSTIGELVPNRALGGVGVGGNAIAFMECNPCNAMLYVGTSPAEFKRLLSDETSDSSKNLRARMGHERDHLFRHWSTSYGFFQDHLAALSGLAFRFAFTSAREHQRGFLFPLLNEPKQKRLLDGIGSVGRDTGDFFAEVKEFGLFYGRSDAHTKDCLMYLGHESLARALKDSISRKFFPLPFHTLALTDKRVFRSSSSGMQLAAWMPEFEIDLYEHSSPWLARTLNESLVAGEPEKYLLGATHLMEFMAVVHEMGHCEILNPSRPSWHELLELKDKSSMALIATDQYQYQLVWDYWENTFGEDSFLRESSIWFSIPMELFAAVDLALWMPITPSGFRSPRGNLTWLDIQPGWRFIKILRQLREIGLTPSSHPNKLEDRNQRFRMIQAEICGALGWATVEEIATEWIRFFDASIAKGGLDPKFRG